MPDLWEVVDQATASGLGAETLDLSPYGAVIAALVAARGAALFDSLAGGKKTVFVPYEVTLPDLRDDVRKKVIRTMAPSSTLTFSADVLILDKDPAE